MLSVEFKKSNSCCCTGLKASGVCYERGFSLIEVCILIIIISLILTPTVYILNIYYKKFNQAVTQHAVDTATSALTKYALKYGRYPVPADPSLAAGAEKFGRPAESPPLGWPDCQSDPPPDPKVICQTTRGTYPRPAAPLVDGPPVLIGVLPFAEIGVPITSVLDEKGNLLRYAVTLSLTSATDFDERNGAIEVLDQGDAAGQNPRSIYFSNSAGIDSNTRPRAHFVVVSSGADMRGAFATNGTIPNDCGDVDDSADYTNCDRDGVFRDNSLRDVGRKEYFYALGPGHFDDYVGAVNATSSGLWSTTPVVGGENMGIIDRLGGNIAIGNCGGRSPCVPVSKLDVYGAVRATDAVKAYRFMGRGPDTPNSSWFATDDARTVQPMATSTGDGACVGTACPADVNVEWGATNIPPFLMPETIAGIPPEEDTEPYFIDDTAGMHGPFIRGNGILCPNNTAMVGIFDNDEACDSTVSFNMTTFSCPNAGTYAKGINADGTLNCSTTVDNQPAPMP